MGILWSVLLEKFHIKIHFAHQTFKWSNDAKGNAAVFCVIIGFATFDTKNKRLFLYESVRSDPYEIQAKNINPYLVDAPDVVISNRSKPLCNVPVMMYGNKPTDGGNFLMSKTEMEEMIKNDPRTRKVIRPFISGEEFLHNNKRYCIWLVDVNPTDIREMPEVMRRVEAVKKIRSESKAASTRNYPYPTLFRQVTQPKTDYIIVPRVSSENRAYIPM